MSKWLNDYSHSELQKMVGDLLKDKGETQSLIQAAEAYFEAAEDKIVFYGIPNWDISEVSSNLIDAIKEAKGDE